MSELDRLIKGASFIFVFSIIANLAGMASRILLAQGYSPDVFGKIMVGYTVFGLLGTVSVWGLNTALAYFIPSAESRTEEYEFISSAVLMGIGISLPITVLTVVFRERVSNVLFQEAALSQYLLPFVLAIPVYVLLNLVVGTFRGYELVKLKAYSKDLLYNLTQLVLIAVFIFLGISGEFVGYIYVFAAGLGVVVSLGLLLRYRPPTAGVLSGLSMPSMFEYWGRYLGYATPVIILTLTNWGINYIDTFLIQFFEGSIQVGFYKAVYPLAIALITFLGSFGFLYLPSLSRLYGENKFGEARNLYSIATYVVFILTLPAFLCILFFAGPIIDVLYPDPYSVAGVALQLLAIAFFIEVVFGLNSASLNALNRTKSNAIITLASFMTNVGLNLVLIPRFGIDGAALATVAALLVWNILTSSWLYAKESLHPFTTFYLRGAAAGFVLTASLYYGGSQLVPIVTELGTLYQVLFLSTALLIGGFLNLLIMMNTIPDALLEEIDFLSLFDPLRLT